MHYRDQLKERAEKARDKKAAIGPDVNFEEFDPAPVPHSYMAEEELCALPMADQKNLLMAGLDVSGKGRGGTFFQKDTSVVHCQAGQEDVEVLSIKKALEEHDWLEEYYWKLATVDADKYTAAAELDLHDGYVIRSKPGSSTVYPIQACMYLDKEGLQQNVHNIIIAEEDSELHIITGCATSPHMKRGLHVGISEFFVKKNAKLSFTMIHNWAENMAVRPRSVARVEAGGQFVNNYICMKPVRSLQMYPTTHLTGPDAVARFYSIVMGSPGSEYDMGGRIILNHPGNRAEIVSRVISNGGNVVARGHLVGKEPEIKAHLECRGLLLNGGLIHAIPELEGHVDGVEMSHEAAVGKIAQEEITYLQARGLTEDEATATIVRGFLSVDIPGLPQELQAEIDRAVEESDKDVM